MPTVRQQPQMSGLPHGKTALVFCLFLPMKDPTPVITSDENRYPSPVRSPWGSLRKERHLKRAETKELPGGRKQELKRKATDTPEESL